MYHEPPIRIRILIITGFIIAYFLPIFIQAQVIHTTPVTSNHKTYTASPNKQTATTPEPLNPYASIDKKALQIPDSLTRSTSAIASYINANFTQDTDKLRAAFIWVATNIRYDVPDMYAIDYNEKNEDMIARALQIREGICENYAALFADISQKLGIATIVIQGYTKQANQVSSLAHAWCAAHIDTAWYLFDPTWAAGYVSNGTFFPKINPSYYDINPSVCIQTHMPFDPIWQMLNHPISFTDFNEGKFNGNPGTPFYNFSDSITRYMKQLPDDQDLSSYARIDYNGAKSPPVFNRLSYIHQKIEQRKYDEFNAAVVNYNDAIANFNDFIRYRNKQFTPLRPDVEIQAMLDSASNPYHEAKSQLSQIRDPDAKLQLSVNAMQKQMTDFSGQLSEQQDWLAKYFSKGKSGRKGMFTKVTWFGIPLN